MQGKPTFWVLVGAHDVNDEKTGYLIKVACVNPHPNYMFYTKPFDFAMLTLVKLIKFSKTIQPACLPSPHDDFLGADLTVSGWGWIKATDGASKSTKLRSATVKPLYQDVCQYLFQGVNPNITETMLCAGYLEGGIDACLGDSGGKHSGLSCLT